MSALPAEALGVAAPSTRRSSPPGRAANAATYLPLPAALREPPRPPEGSRCCPADAPLAARVSAYVRRQGCRPRTTRLTRARRRSSASTKRLPAPLRPTTWRRQSFRGKELRRATLPTGLTCQANHPTVRRQRPLSRQTTPPLYLADPLGSGSALPKNRERLIRKRRKICRHAYTCSHYVLIPNPLSATRKTGVWAVFCA